MTKHQADRAAWYDRESKAPDRPDAPTIRMSKSNKDKLSLGYTKLATPSQSLQGHAQTKADRNRVGSKWPGPGKKLHGRSSPATGESFLKQKRAPETSHK
jgi:hypothetical protein